ncbi:MAG: HEPN domain-containing protein [Candidatus Sumerlaeota bacterium]|nr:HEPN domain-containing protein [Candidatus Sumerlaeota bacterium]
MKVDEAWERGMDIEKQIAYWRDSAEEDIVAARRNIEIGLIRHGLFWAHLALEKILKAHVAKETRAIPPYIHNLVRLARIANVPLSEDREEFLRQFDVYQMFARYPGSSHVSIDPYVAKRNLEAAEEALQWLRQILDSPEQ